MPYCEEELKPKMGQLFDVLEDGEQFYKRYAHSVGFSVCCSSENKNKMELRVGNILFAPKKVTNQIKQKM